MEENTNIDVLGETKENYLRPYKYVWMCCMKYHDHIHIKEIQSWIKQSRQAETKDHESIDSEVAILLSKVCAFCEE